MLILIFRKFNKKIVTTFWVIIKIYKKNTFKYIFIKNFEEAI